MSRHWASCRPCEEMNVEYQVSTSLRWLGTSGLNTITTPLESFIKAGQHDSNLCTFNIEWIYSGRNRNGLTNLSLVQREYICSTYLKSPAQSHSSTSHDEFLLPFDKLCDSNSSILHTEKWHIWIDKNKTFGQAANMYTCCNNIFKINPPYSLCGAVVSSDCFCCVRQKIGQCCFPTLSIWNVKISDLHK